MSLVRTLCCCAGQELSDDERLIDEDPINDEYLPYGRHATASMGQNPATSSVESPADISRSKTRDQVEQELLKNILERTRENIMNVSQFDDEVDTGRHQRSARYSQAIRIHEAANETVALSTLLTPIGATGLPYVLSTAETDAVDLEVLKTWTKACSAAIKAGISIEPRDDLVMCLNIDCD